MSNFDTARDAVDRMRQASDDCASFDRDSINGPIIADIMQQSLMQNYAAACIDAGRELPAVLSDAERYRLAWMSARRRAQTERGSHDMTASSFEIFVESMREQAQAAAVITNGLRAQVAELQESAIRHAERHREIFDAQLRRIAELTDQRDEARAEVERLGKQLEAQRIATDARVSAAKREGGSW